MDKGAPVSVLFIDEVASRSPMLYCELIQRARYGESFLVRGQRCVVGAYVLRETEIMPVDYYYDSGRYENLNAARTAIESLRRTSLKGKSIRITPLSEEKFDVLILFLRPERAMRIVQAHTFLTGRPVDFSTGGIASVCSDCTAYPLQGKMGISLGCKGGRKHSKYSDDEVIVAIPFDLARAIEESLGKIPGTFD